MHYYLLPASWVHTKHARRTKSLNQLENTILQHLLQKTRHI